MTLAPSDALLGLGLLVACWTDLRSQKIPNALTFPLMATGLLAGVVEGRGVEAIVGLLAAFGVHFALFALQVDRAGDAKLMMGLGAFWGWAEMLEATAWSFVVFAPLGLLWLVRLGRLGSLGEAWRWTLRRTLGRGDPGPRPPGTLLAKAPAILAGAAIARFTDVLGLLG